MARACRVERWDLPWSGEAPVALDPLVAGERPVVVFDGLAGPAGRDAAVIGRADWRDRTWDLAGPERAELRWIEDGVAHTLLRVDLVEPISGRVQGGLYRLVRGPAAG